ncbi:MAG: peroxiredoxin family protein, partial [Planctomycetota bacterium]
TGTEPATTLATARTYRVRCWLTAEKHAEIAVETTELLALQGLSDDDRYKLLFYCGSAAVALEKRDLANDCVEKLKALNPDIASALRRVVAQKWSPIVVGEAPPQWELARINTHGDTATEGTLKLGDLKGKYVLLDFWATWCGPCKSLMQAELEPMHAEWAKDKRFELVSIGTNWSGDTAEKQKAYAISKNYHWTKVYDSTGEVTDAYGVQGIPTLTLIGPDGKVIAHGYAGEVIPKVKEILAKLGEPGSAGPEQTDPQKQPRIEDF